MTWKSQPGDLAEQRPKWKAPAGKGGTRGVSFSLSSTKCCLDRGLFPRLQQVGSDYWCCLPISCSGRLICSFACLWSGDRWRVWAKIEWIMSTVLWRTVDPIAALKSIHDWVYNQKNRQWFQWKENLQLLLFTLLHYLSSCGSIKVKFEWRYRIIWKVHEMNKFDLQDWSISLSSTFLRRQTMATWKSVTTL